MAFCIPNAKVTVEIKRKIAKDLIFSAKKYVPGIGNTNGVPINLFKREKNKEGTFDYIVPYRYGVDLFNKIKRPELSKLDTKFTGKLDKDRDQCKTVKKAAKQLEEKFTASFNLYCGGGKTVMTIYTIIKHLNIGPILVLYKKGTLGKQWVGSIEKRSNMKATTLNHKNPPILAQTINDEGFHVVISTPQQVEKCTNEYIRQFKVLVLDEAHMFCGPKTVVSLLKIRPRYMIACTATPTHGQGLYNMIQAFVGKELNIQVFPKPVNIIKVITNIEPPNLRTENGADYNKIVNYLGTNSKRYKLLLHYLTVLYSDKKFVILAMYHDEVEYLEKRLKKDLGKRHVQTLYKSQKDYKNCRVLIGTYGKLAAGFDEEETCKGFDGNRINLLVLWSSIKSVVDFPQSIGRAFRSNEPIIIDFVDNHIMLERHYKKRKQYYKILNSKIQEVKITWNNRKFSFEDELSEST